MTDYLKQVHNVVVSTNSDYTNPWLTTDQWPDAVLTPTYAEMRAVRAQTGGTTIPTGVYTAITKFMLLNRTTGNVTVTWTDTGANANTHVVPALQYLDLPGIAVTADITVTAATEGTCWVLLCGTST